MKLLITDRSPFARKCRAVAHAKGLLDQIELQETDIFGNPEEVRASNPLGKIPTLIRDDGSVIIDSPVICEYFDVIGGGNRLVPSYTTDAEKRFAILHVSAIADGMLDSAVEIVLESLRPQEKQYDAWLDKHKGNLLRGTTILEKEHIDSLKGDTPDMAKLTVAVMLDYISNRLDGIGHAVHWQAEAPSLTAWLDDWLQHPSLQASAPREW